MGFQLANVASPGAPPAHGEPGGADKGADHRTTPDDARLSILKPSAHERLH